MQLCSRSTRDARSTARPRRGQPLITGTMSLCEFGSVVHRDTPEFGCRSPGRVRNPESSGFSLCGVAAEAAEHKEPWAPYREVLEERESRRHGGTENPHPAEVL